MIYPWLKSAHIFVMILWIGGMLAAPLITAALSQNGAGSAIRAWPKAIFSRVVTPAMIATLALGVWLAQLGDRFMDGWLMAKLILVLVMTALHGVISGRLRRFAGDASAPIPEWFARLPILVLVLLGLIVVLVVRKSIF